MLTTTKNHSCFLNGFLFLTLRFTPNLPHPVFPAAPWFFVTLLYFKSSFSETQAAAA